jgi:hypothetical protein
MFAFAGDLPGLPPALITAIVGWILKIAGGLGILFMVISFVKQLPPDKRDWQAMGYEILGTLMVIAIIVKAEEITKYFLGLMGITM